MVGNGLVVNDVVAEGYLSPMTSSPLSLYFPPALLKTRSQVFHPSLLPRRSLIGVGDLESRIQRRKMVVVSVESLLQLGSSPLLGPDPPAEAQLHATSLYHNVPPCQSQGISHGAGICESPAYRSLPSKVRKVVWLIFLKGNLSYESHPCLLCQAWVATSDPWRLVKLK